MSIKSDHIPAVAVYENLRKRWAETSTSPSSKAFGSACSAAAAGSVAALITQPVDVVKTRVMLANSKGTDRTLMQVAREIWTQEGLRGIMKGGLMRCAWVAGERLFLFPATYGEVLIDCFLLLMHSRIWNISWWVFMPRRYSSDLYLLPGTYETAKMWLKGEFE